jgi:hypothetical protein
MPYPKQQVLYGGGTAKIVFWVKGKVDAKGCGKVKCITEMLRMR